MHVGWRFMGDKGLTGIQNAITINAKEYNSGNLGQRKGLSPTDLEKIKLTYVSWLELLGRIFKQRFNYGRKKLCFRHLLLS